MPTIYCSVCADTSSLSGASCLHCGAVSRGASYELTGQALIALMIILALSVFTVWGFAKSGTPNSPLGREGLAVDHRAESVSVSAPDRFAQNRSPTPQRLKKSRDA